MNTYRGFIILLYHGAISSAELLHVQSQLEALSNDNEVQELKPIFFGGSTSDGYAYMAWNPHVKDKGRSVWLVVVRASMMKEQFYAYEVTCAVVSGYDVSWNTLMRENEQIPKSHAHIEINLSEPAHINTGEYALTYISWDPTGKYLAVNSGTNKHNPTIAYIQEVPQGLWVQFEPAIKFAKDAHDNIPFIPRFWLSSPGIRICDGTACYKNKDSQWLFEGYELPFAREKNTVIKYIQPGAEALFGIVTRASSVQLKFDVVIMDAAGRLREKHNLCNGIAMADVYCRRIGGQLKDYIIAYAPQSGALKTLNVQRINLKGNLVGNPRLLKFEHLVTAITWRIEPRLALPPGILVAELHGKKTKISLYEWNNAQKDPQFVEAWILERQGDRQIVRMQVSPTGEHLAVLFDDFALGIYKMPERQNAVWD